MNEQLEITIKNKNNKANINGSYEDQIRVLTVLLEEMNHTQISVALKRLSNYKLSKLCSNVTNRLYDRLEGARVPK